MKILAVSLLRIGDVLQQLPLLQGLYRKYDKAEIHLLINRQCQGIIPFLEEKFENIHLFDRELYLKRISSQNSLDERLEAIQDSLPELPEFDFVYNFSHTRLSVDVIASLNTRHNYGLHRDSEGRMDLQDNRWLQYYNECFAGNRKSFFHGNDLLANGFALSVERYDVEFRASNLIAVQCFTSDPKKNWPLTQFAQLKREIEKSYPQSEVRFLCAPQEKAQLLEFFSENEVISCSFSEAYELLKHARLLISVDTSIKHLGALAQIPIVEISLGGSDALKTGAYACKTWSVHANVPCYPCVHSQSCSQKSHLCAEHISVKNVLKLVGSVLEKKSLQEKKSVHKAVWEAYLSQEERNESLQLWDYCRDIKKLSGLLKDLEDSLKEVKSQIESRGEAVSTKALMPSLLVLRSALSKDPGNYLGSLKDAFTDRYVDTGHLFFKVFKELTKAKELVRLHLFLFNEIDQDGYGEAHDAP